MKKMNLSKIFLVIILYLYFFANIKILYMVKHNREIKIYILFNDFINK